MDGPGTITWEEFLENAESFVQLSDAISDNWELRGKKTIPGQAYLYRQVKIFVPNNYLVGDMQMSGEEESKDKQIGSFHISDPFEANSESEQPLVTEHHVLWSMSYGVPELYFNAWLSGATVKILTEDGKFKGLFFSTPDMKRSMNAWPEVVCIDGTYLLLRINLTVMILLVEDSNASSEIVGVALITKEDYTTFKWFLETFRKENSSGCDRINCFMGDKDLLERDVLKEVFPGVPVYICLFHTLKIFSREITIDKMDALTLNEKRKQRDKCLRILQNLAYSSSETEYENHYVKFQTVAPTMVLDYYNKNWHGNREEWTCYSMTSGNLFNRTNNRLESMNAKIKQLVLKCSSLVDFADSFFVFMESHQHQVDLMTSKSFTRRRTAIFSADSAENQYMELLTREAFEYVLIEMKAHDHFQIREQTDFNWIIEADNLVLHVTSSSCECGIAKTSLLPCRHIFAVRKLLRLPLFSEDLCNERWTKRYCMKHQRSFQKTSTTKATEIIYEPPAITNGSAAEVTTVTARKKMLLSITSDLKNICCQSCGPNFTIKLKTIERVIASWEQNVEICIISNNNKRGEASNRLSIPKNMNRMKQTVQQKRKLIEPLTSKLVQLGLQSLGNEFKKKVDIIKKIENFWRQQLNVTIEEASADQDVSLPEKSIPDSKCINTLNQSSSNDDPIWIHQQLVKRFELLLKPKPVPINELSRIEMPLAIKRIGRPSGSMNTWINIKKTAKSKKE